MLLTLNDHLSKLYGYSNQCYPKITFSLEKENHENISFFNVTFSGQNDKFVTFVNRNLYLSEFILILPALFLLLTYNLLIIQVLTPGFSFTCSDWKKFHNELLTLKKLFLKKQTNKQKHGYLIVV